MDPISNMLSSISNASRVNKSTIIGVSKLKLRILEILKKEGIIKDFSLVQDDPRSLVIRPDLEVGEKIVRISKPGRRLYIKAKQIRLKPGFLQIISTPIGILTAQEARKKHIGGELLFEVRQ